MKNLLQSPVAQWIIRLFLGLTVIFLLLARAKPEQFLGALKNVSPWVPIIAVLFYWLTQCLSAAKWRLLLKARGAEFSFWECARFYLLGMFCSLFLPTTIGGDGVRALITGPRCGGTAAAASAILVERLTGLTAMLILGTLGIALWSAESSSLGASSLGTSPFGATLLPRIFAILALAALAFFAMRLTAYRLEKVVAGKPRKIVQKWAKLHREIDFYTQRERWLTLLWAMGISFIFQSAHIGINIFLARAAGLQTPTMTFLWLVPLLSLTSMIPLGIGGLGVREAAAVAVLSHQAPQGTILAWSLLLQATIWLSSLPGSLFLGEWQRRRAN